VRHAVGRAMGQTEPARDTHRELVVIEREHTTALNLDPSFRTWTHQLLLPVFDVDCTVRVCGSPRGSLPGASLPLGSNAALIRRLRARLGRSVPNSPRPGAPASRKTQPRCPA